MSDDRMPMGHEAIMLYYTDTNGEARLVSATSPLPVSGGGGGNGGTSSVQVIAAALQNPGTDSTAPLAANAEFAGGWQEVLFTQSRFSIGAGADVNGHLYLEASPDNGTTIFPIQDAAVPAGGWGQLNTIMVGFPVQYRARYVNGPDAQTRFLLAHNATFA